MLQKFKTKNRLTLMEGISFLFFFAKNNKKIGRTARKRTTKMPAQSFQKTIKKPKKNVLKSETKPD
jgi:hypothetical protein